MYRSYVLLIMRGCIVPLKRPQRLRIADGSIIRKLFVILQIGVRSLHRQISPCLTVFQTVAPKKQRTALEPNLSQGLWKFL
jgi:hypothetical protein